MNKQEIEKAINGLEQLKPLLQALLIQVNNDGLGKEDAREIGEHFDIALWCMEQQLNGGWIFCEDRMPNVDNIMVLIQDKYKNLALAVYKDGKFYFLNQTNTTIIKGAEIKHVLVWHYIPEPYKEDKDAERN